MSLEIIELEMVALGLLVLAAHFGGVLCNRLGIGEVTGQILGGVIVGPHCLNLLLQFASSTGLDQVTILGFITDFLESHATDYAAVFGNLQFFVFIFLGVITFSVGEELHSRRIKTIGMRGVIVCLSQAVATWALLSLGFLLLGFRPIYAFIIGSIGATTAPALTFALMNRLRIEGHLRTMVANIIVLGDFIQIVVFSIALTAGVMLETRHEVALLRVCGLVLKEVLLAGAFGVGVFLLLKVLIPKRIKITEAVPTEDGVDFLTQLVSEHPTPSVEIMLIIFGTLSVGLSIAMAMHLPFLVTAMVAGFLISNFHSHALFDSLKLENITPVLNLLFFGIVGATVELESFTRHSIYLIAAYLLLRGSGKVLGTWLGCRLTQQDPKITACVPRLMLPQTGIAAVETLLVAQMLAEGSVIFQIIIPGIVVFEIGGAWLAERTLMKWKTWAVGERSALEATAASVTPGDYSVANLVGERVLYDFRADDKEAAVAALSQYLKDLGVISAVDSIVQHCLERETLGTTAIGNGIAFPHCRTAEVDHIIGACAMLREGNAIDWNAPDGKPVRLIFLLISPDAKPEQHLHALQAIAATLQQTGFAERLERAARERTVAELFEEFSPRGYDGEPKQT